MRVLAFLVLLSVVVPVTAQDPLARARGLIAKQGFSKAIKALKKSEPAVRKGSDALRLFTEAHRGLKEHETVLDYSSAYLTKKPRDAEVQEWAGEALLALGRRDAARRDKAAAWYEQALEAATAALAIEAHRLGAVRIQVLSLLHLGRSAEALKAAKASASGGAGNPRRHYLVALVHELSGRPGTAVGILVGLGKKHPDEAWIHRERGRIHLANNQLEEALEAFRACLVAKNLDDASRRLGGEQIWNLCAKYRDFKRAIPLADAWIKAHPKDADAHWWRGYLHELNADAGAAKHSYDRSWKASGGNHGMAALHLGHLHFDKGDEAQACEFLGHAIRLKARPRTGTWTAEDRLILIGREHLNAGRLEQAGMLLEKHGAANGPDDWRLLQNVAFVLREWGSAEAGKKRKSKARRIWKRSAKYYVRASKLVLDTQAPPRTKAQVLNDTGLMFHYHLRQVAKGVSYYKRALEFDELYLDALENMGVVEFQKKRWKKAVVWFDKVIALAGNRQVARRYRELALKQLERKKR